MARGAVRDVFLALSVAASLAALVATAWLARGLDPTAHAHHAVAGALLVYAAFHAFVGLVASAFALAQTWRGYASAARRLPVEVAGLWQLYTAATGLVCLVLALQAPEALR